MARYTVISIINKNVCKASPAHSPIAQLNNCCPTGGIGIPTRASDIAKVTIKIETAKKNNKKIKIKR